MPKRPARVLWTLTAVALALGLTACDPAPATAPSGPLGSIYLRYSQILYSDWGGGSLMQGSFRIIGCSAGGAFAGGCAGIVGSTGSIGIDFKMASGNTFHGTLHTTVLGESAAADVTGTANVSALTLTNLTGTTGLTGGRVLTITSWSTATQDSPSNVFNMSGTFTQEITLPGSMGSQVVDCELVSLLWTR